MIGLGEGVEVGGGNGELPMYCLPYNNMAVLVGQVSVNHAALTFRSLDRGLGQQSASNKQRKFNCDSLAKNNVARGEVKRFRRP